MNFTPLGKIIVAKKNPPKKKSREGLILSKETEEQLETEDVAKDASYHFTLTVLATGPEVRPEITKGCKIVIASSRWPMIDRIYVNEVEYLVIPDSESFVPVIIPAKIPAK